jgi:hypothetical protein
MRLPHLVSGVTKRLLFGPFLTQDRGALLRQLGVTHVLNVCEAPSIVTCAEAGFREIHDCAIADLAIIPADIAVTCVKSLHEMLRDEHSKVYVHCIAGQNRSPTIVWLYLIACGLPAADAKARVEAGAADAVPGHKSLANEELVGMIAEFGRQHLRPIPARVLEAYE